MRTRCIVVLGVVLLVWGLAGPLRSLTEARSGEIVGRDLVLPGIDRDVDPRPLPVVFLGDSITNGSQGVIRAKAPPWAGSVSVLAMNNQRIADMHGHYDMAELPLPEDSWIVVELGTNDIGSENPRALDDLAALAKRLSASPCVVWVTIDEPFDPAPPAAADLNNDLRYLAGLEPAFHVADWNAVVHPPEGDRVKELTADGIHPNPLGQQELAELMWRTLGEQCSRP